VETDLGGGKTLLGKLAHVVLNLGRSGLQPGRRGALVRKSRLADSLSRTMHTTHLHTHIHTSAAVYTHSLTHSFIHTTSSLSTHTHTNTAQHSTTSQHPELTLNYFVVYKKLLLY
jgi:hypothetical protein